MIRLNRHSRQKLAAIGSAAFLAFLHPAGVVAAPTQVTIGADRTQTPAVVCVVNAGACLANIGSFSAAGVWTPANAVTPAMVGQPNGVPSTDSTGKVPAAQLPIGTAIVGVGGDDSTNTSTATGGSAARTFAARAADVTNVMDYGAKCDVHSVALTLTAGSNVATLGMADPLLALSQNIYGGGLGGHVTIAGASGQAAGSTVTLSANATASGSFVEKVLTDDTAAINTAIAAASAKPNFTVWSPRGRQCGVYYGSINAAMLTGPGTIDLNIFSAATTVATVDALGSQLITWRGTIAPQAYGEGQYGLIIGYNGSNNLEDLNIVGAASKCMLLMDEATNALGVNVNVKNLDTSNVSYGTCLDGENHWNPTSSYYTGPAQPVDTISANYGAMNEVTFTLGAFAAYGQAGSSALWLGHQHMLSLTGTYLGGLHTLGNHAVTLYTDTNGCNIDPSSLIRLDVHSETYNTLTSDIFVSGPCATPKINSLRYSDDLDDASTTIFSADTNITNVTLHHLDLDVTRLAIAGVTAFDQPGLYSVDGHVHLPTLSSWNAPKSMQGELCADDTGCNTSSPSSLTDFGHLTSQPFVLACMGQSNSTGSDDGGNEHGTTVTASLANGVLTVSAIASPGLVFDGTVVLLSDVAGNVPAGVHVTAQLSGTTGGVGTYQTDASTSLSVSSESMATGTKTVPAGIYMTNAFYGSNTPTAIVPAAFGVAPLNNGVGQTGTATAPFAYNNECVQEAKALKLKPWWPANRDIVVVFADRGSTSMANWIDQNTSPKPPEYVIDMWATLTNGLALVAANYRQGFVLNHINWRQGEADASASGTYGSAALYGAGFARLVAKFQALPYYVAGQTRMTVGQLGTWYDNSQQDRNDFIDTLGRGSPTYPWISEVSASGAEESIENSGPHFSGRWLTTDGQRHLEAYLKSFDGAFTQDTTANGSAQAYTTNLVLPSATVTYLRPDQVSNGAVITSQGGNLYLPPAQYSKGSITLKCNASINVLGYGGGAFIQLANNAPGTPVVSFPCTGSNEWLLSPQNGLWVAVRIFPGFGNYLDYTLASGVLTAGAAQNTLPSQALEGAFYNTDNNTLSLSVQLPGSHVRFSNKNTSGGPTIVAINGGLNLVNLDGSVSTTYTVPPGDVIDIEFGYLSGTTQAAFLVSDSFRQAGYLMPYLVSALPACSSSSNKGRLVEVSDQSGTPTYGGALTGGGSTPWPAFCNGSGWTAH